MPSKSDIQIPEFRGDEDFARELDHSDPLARLREEFHIPRATNGEPCVYLAGNSLGLQPKAARSIVLEELDQWARLGVDGHFEGERPWYSYHELLRETGARLVGAKPGEVVAMNSLTANLHLMMVSFYRPTRDRCKIMIEEPCFPSDIYAVKSQIGFHGHDPKDALVVLRPREGEWCIRWDDIASTIERERERLSLVMLGGVNFVTGQLLDMRRIAELGHRFGAVVGFDLAHAAGNVLLQLHEWGVDFAVWCNYKYLNSGPGAVGGCFVHEKHSKSFDLPRFAGWWGNDPSTRFKMHLQPEFIPREGADGWQLSNPPILALAPVKVSYDLFDSVGMDALRTKSMRLTAYMEFLLDALLHESCEAITPRNPAERGCQLSLKIGGNARNVLSKLHHRGVVCDFREPNVIRAAPVPLYNSYCDVWRFVESLRSIGKS
ncbi:MAG: kynureninase [Planctomycetes bacterium]|nr:kynureninase [Planctomycetota bacterium]MBI3833566.1 kynureninase [Planctomycetota bacterium]